MKHPFRRITLIVLALICALSAVSCDWGATSGTTDDPTKQQTEQTRVITLAASTLSLPDGSGFSVSFSEENGLWGGIKTALPACGNAYLNDLISSAVNERLGTFAPTDGSPAAVDLEDCRRSGDLYSFLFALYYNLPDHARTVVRFWLSADLGGGALLTLGDLIKVPYFENGSVNEYISAYLKEHYTGAYDEQKAATYAQSSESLDGFYVSESGAVLVIEPDLIASKESLEVYLSNAAIALYKRKGTTSPSEPQSTITSEYEPAQDGEKVVAMTFDDGPGSSTTKRLLDYVEANDFKVTFFVNGYNYSNLETDETAKATLRRAVSLGCEIGNHSYSHPYFQYLTPEQRTYQLEYNAELIEAACGVYPNIFRAPGGTFPQGMPEAEDYFYIYWDADGEDWKYKKEDAQSVANRYLKLIGPGSIVLFHDIYQTSVDAAIIVMNTLKAQGYRFVTVSELLNLEDKIPDGTIYTSQNGTRNYFGVEKNG